MPARLMPSPFDSHTVLTVSLPLDLMVLACLLVKSTRQSGLGDGSLCFDSVQRGGGGGLVRTKMKAKRKPMAAKIIQDGGMTMLHFTCTVYGTRPPIADPTVMFPAPFFFFRDCFARRSRWDLRFVRASSLVPMGSRLQKSF